MIQYKVLPFVAAINHDGGSADAAAQLETLVNEHSAEGWEYVRLETVQTYVAGKSGCFGIGSVEPKATTFSMVVFRR